MGKLTGGAEPANPLGRRRRVRPVAAALPRDPRWDPGRWCPEPWRWFRRRARSPSSLPAQRAPARCRGVPASSARRSPQPETTEPDDGRHPAQPEPDAHSGPPRGPATRGLGLPHRARSSTPSAEGRVRGCGRGALDLASTQRGDRRRAPCYSSGCERAPENALTPDPGWAHVNPALSDRPQMARCGPVGRQELAGGQCRRTWAYRLGSMSAPARWKYACQNRPMFSASSADFADAPDT